MSSFNYDSAFSPSPPNTGTESVDTELQNFVQLMQHRAGFQTKVNQLTSLCWDRCFSGYNPNKIDLVKSNCMENCTERYMDVSLLIRNRFQAMLGKLQQQQ
ncbi:unnamed protein product [Dicrocoelium dendriticum]|nr:unnamed protein product [Dicrocoelium dendriticum]